MSTSTSKPIGSLIPTDLLKRASPILDRPGAPGLGGARNSRAATPPPLPVQIPEAPAIEVGEARIERLLRGCEDDCALLKTWLNTDWQDRRSIMSDVAIATRSAAERALRQLDLATPPGKEEDVAELLLAFVEMLNVLEPGERGIRLYVAALEVLPLCLYPKAAMIVARTHRWRSLPTPADFIASVAGELGWLRIQRSLLVGTIDQLTTTLNQRDHQRRIFG